MQIGYAIQHCASKALVATVRIALLSTGRRERDIRDSVRGHGNRHALYATRFTDHAPLLRFASPSHPPLSTEVPLPHLVKFGCATLFSAVCSFTPARRRHIGVAIAIAAETPWKRRGW